MGKVEGVVAVAFDCKTATVAMKTGATLKEADAEKALKDAGFGMRSFAAGARPAVQACTFELKEEATALASNDSSPAGAHALADPAAVAAKLRAKLPELDELAIDRDGRAVAVAKKGAKLSTSEQFQSAARELHLTVASFAASDWPASFVAYDVSVPSLSKSSDVGAVRRALAAPRNVLAVQLDPVAHAARVYVREPCDNLATIVSDALAPLGLQASKVEKTARDVRGG